MKNNSGFTLIELMIVVEIIAIVVAIVIPDYMRARIQTNETVAVKSLRTILDAQVSYNSAHLVYATNYAELSSGDPPFLDPGFQPVRNGYQYTVAGEPYFFTALATPVEFGDTGWRGFYIDATGVIRSQLGAPANAESPPLGSSDADDGAAAG